LPSITQQPAHQLQPTKTNHAQPTTAAWRRPWDLFGPPQSLPPAQLPQPIRCRPAHQTG